MMIGGIGSVPKDLGVEVSKTMFAPRVGVAYRVDAEDGRARRLRHHQRSVLAGAAACARTIRRC